MVPDGNSRWGIVGGGILGMTLAYRLAAQGKRVTLFEKSDHLGGLADAWRLGEIVWDRYYHVILPDDLALLDLFRELGLEERIQWVETKSGFFYEGRFLSISSLSQFLRFPALSVVDRLRLAFSVFYGARLADKKKLEGIPAVRWLAKISGKNTMEKIWVPLLRAKLGDNYRAASAAFIQAAMKRMYGARKGSTKKERMGYVKGGYAAVLKTYEAALIRKGVAISCSSPVRSIRQKDNDSGFIIEGTDGRKETFHGVVLTVPAPRIPDMCPMLSAEETAVFRRHAYQGIICLSMLTPGPLTPFYTTALMENRMPFTAVIEMTHIVDRRCFNGHSLVYLPIYLPADSPDFALWDKEIAGRFLDALEAMLPQFRRDQTAALRVARTRHVFPVPTVHFHRIRPSIATSLRDLFIVNSVQITEGTHNVNETVRLANWSAETIRRVHG